MSSETLIAEGVVPEPRSGWSRRRWLLVGLVAVLVLSVGALAWEWRHPEQAFGGGYGMKVKRQVGEPVWSTLVHSGRPGVEQVSITSLEPQFETDGTEAVVEYVICELDPEVLAADGVGGFGYGMRARDVERYCTRTRPATGASFPLRSQPPQELLFGVTPSRPGRTVVAGHRLGFRVGWQRGIEELHVELRLVGRPQPD